MRDWLRNIRETAGLSQEQAAARAGISQQYYSLIEREERGALLPVPTAKKIAAALDFAWTSFFDESLREEGKKS